MTEVPSLGTRVSIRYRLPADDHSMTDVIGYLEAIAPNILVRTKSGEVVVVSPSDVVTVRELSAVPVRTSEIRALEHAAALAWPGTEQHWHEGWLLRAAGGHTSRGNSAIPLDFSATITALPAIIEWYSERGLPPRVSIPERLIPIRATADPPIKVMTADLVQDALEAVVSLHNRPNQDWMTIYDRDIPVDVLLASSTGNVTFASIPDSCVGRGAITTAPGGTSWLGISSVNTVATQRREGHARALCGALKQWGAQHGAQRAYVQVALNNTAAISLYESLGFRLHHHYRYLDARSLITRTL